PPPPRLPLQDLYTAAMDSWSDEVIEADIDSPESRASSRPPPAEDTAQWEAPEASPAEEEGVEEIAVEDIEDVRPSQMPDLVEGSHTQVATPRENRGEERPRPANLP